MSIAEQMQQPMRQGGAPGIVDDLGAEEDVAECSGHAGGQAVASIDRKRKDICYLIDPKMLTLERFDLWRRHEPQAQLTVDDALRAEHLDRKRACKLGGGRDATAVRSLDGDHAWSF